MRQESNGYWEEQVLKLCHLHRQLAELTPEEESEETLVIKLPENHPLNRIVPTEERIKQIETSIKLIEEQIEQMMTLQKKHTEMIDKIGQMTFNLHQIIIGSIQAQANSRIITPNRS